METTLQIVGALFYTLNKIALWRSERSNRHRKQWRIIVWTVYLIGLPAWVILLGLNRNWIAATIEAGGAPAMLLGLVLALRGTDDNPPGWLDRLALACIPLGFVYSLWDFGGITTINQWLEIGLVLGFLVGTYKLAKERPSGYLWYILMHVACGWLMWIQGYKWLFTQQMISLVFIADAWRVAMKKEKEAALTKS